MTHGPYGVVRTMGHGEIIVLGKLSYTPWPVGNFYSMTHGAYGVVRCRIAHASWDFVMSYGPWVMEKKSLKGLRLTHCEDTMVNEQEYIKLGLFCAEICTAPEQGMGKKKLKDLSKSVRGAINKLKT